MSKQSKEFHIFSKTMVLLLSIMLMFLMTACGQQSVTEDPLEGQENFTKYACDEDNIPEHIVYMQLDINPSFILGMTEGGNVISIEANNEDADDVMINFMGDYFNGVSNGVELEYVIQDLARATQQGGYIEDNFDVSVDMISGNLEDGVLEKACSEATTNLAEDDGIVASFEEVSDNNDISSENQDEDGLNDENNVCDLCNGEGTMVCDLCNGEGTVIEIEEREVEVRNDYVCPYCGGVGILDDGMHGGETAVCGYCGGEGKTGSMSGEFREKAFDKKIVEEEVTRPCSRCNGSGIMPCPHCEGTGVIG